MSKKENIFNQIPDLNYQEEAFSGNPEVFEQILKSRRSVRQYDDHKIPDEVMQKALNWALMAPNSSNLQCWEFIWVRTLEKKAELAKLCFNQPAARTAQELVVAVARPTWWRRNSQKMLEAFKNQEDAGEIVPKAAWAYYKKIVPFIYTQGPLNIFGLMKKPFFFFMGFFKVVPRQPTTHEQLKKWAVKSCALACQNFMMGMSAQGFDTCPMEGFDESKVKRFLGIGRKDEITMVISCGKRASSGVYGPRLRFSSENFIKII